VIPKANLIAVVKRKSPFPVECYMLLSIAGARMNSVSKYVKYDLCNMYVLVLKF